MAGWQPTRRTTWQPVRRRDPEQARAGGLTGQPRERAIWQAVDAGMILERKRVWQPELERRDARLAAARAEYGLEAKGRPGGLGCDRAKRRTGAEVADCRLKRLVVEI
jgi:hypothetical protein